MILWVDGGHGPVENMRRDAAMLAASERGAPPVLRLFRFVPPGITIGFAQRPERELDLARCREAGIEWAVRPTGGRAIFHADEWTYSIAAARDEPAWGGADDETRAAVSRVMLGALRALGVPAESSGKHPARATGSRTPRPPGGAAPPCFASTARHEVVLDGRKLLGAARRRTAAGWLEQGSVLWGEGHLRIAEFLAVPDDRRDAVRGALALRSAAAGPWLRGEPSFERWTSAVAAQLPDETTIVHGASGRFLLTVPETDSYTPAATPTGTIMGA